MDLATLLGLAISILGLSKETANNFKRKYAKKIIVTPHLVTTMTRHWSSSNSVIIQNTTKKPLFSVQVVFWHNEHQKLNFKLDSVKKEAMLEDLIINYGVVIFRGNVNKEQVVILEILRLMPEECIEVDLEIEKKGEVRIFPIAFDENQSKQVFISKGDFKYPFVPPFAMKLSSITLTLRKADKV